MISFARARFTVRLSSFQPSAKFPTGVATIHFESPYYPNFFSRFTWHTFKYLVPIVQIKSRYHFRIVQIKWRSEICNLPLTGRTIAETFFVMPKHTKPIPAFTPKSRHADKKLNEEIDKIIEMTEGQNEALGKIIGSGKRHISKSKNMED